MFDQLAQESRKGLDHVHVDRVDQHDPARESFLGAHGRIVDKVLQVLAEKLLHGRHSVHDLSSSRPDGRRLERNLGASVFFEHIDDRLLLAVEINDEKLECAHKHFRKFPVLVADCLGLSMDSIIV